MACVRLKAKHYMSTVHPFDHDDYSLWPIAVQMFVTKADIQETNPIYSSETLEQESEYFQVTNQIYSMEIHHNGSPTKRSAWILPRA